MRDSLDSLIRDARRRKEEEETEEAGYKFRLAVSPHRSVEDDEKGTATHEKTVLQTATSAATHSAENHESTSELHVRAPHVLSQRVCSLLMQFALAILGVRPQCKVLRTCVWQIKKILSMAKHSVRLPYIPVWP